jgi:hypothetical protein
LILNNQGVKECRDAVEFIRNAPDADMELKEAATDADRNGYTIADPAVKKDYESRISNITKALTPAGLTQWNGEPLRIAAQARDSCVDVDFSSDILHRLDKRVRACIRNTVLAVDHMDAGNSRGPSARRLVFGYVMCLSMGSSCNVVNGGYNVFILLPLLFRSGYLHDAQATPLGQCEFVRCTDQFMDDVD